MLARLARELPRGGFVYEPKWDGFRCLAFRSDGEVDLRSRHDRPLGRYFPELVEALLALREQAFVLDGEILPERGALESLLSRIHPRRRASSACVRRRPRPSLPSTSSRSATRTCAPDRSRSGATGWRRSSKPRPRA